MGTSFQFAQFIVSRIVLGLGTGGIVATTSVWQAETSEASSRGEHVSAFGIFCGLGLSIVLWVEFGMSFVQNSASWRLPLVLPVVFSAVVMLFILTLPESPRWLVKVGRVADAEEVLSYIHDVDPESEVVQKEIKEIQLSLELAASTDLRSMSKMGPQRTFHRVCLACIIQVFLQLSGTNAVSYYATTIFQDELHFSGTISYILAASLQAVLILGSLVCSFTVDRYGRRKLLMLSATLTSICMACLTGTTSNPKNSSALKAGVFFVYFLQFCFCLGFLGIPFLYASEIAPVHMRAAVCGVSTAVSWLFK
jgi:MFS family permease